jgi:hypothetical protein
MFEFLFLSSVNIAGSPLGPARSRQTNDPAGHRKQIPLQYAGIGAGYGLTRSHSSAIGRQRAMIDFRDIRLMIPVCGRQSPAEADGRAKLSLLQNRITDP